jgi:serpin B
MRADFSALLSPSSKEVVIDEVLHKTFIRVDEQGTEAAAVTAVMMKVTSMAPQDELVLTFDRPFFYAILDLEAHIPLFLGVLDNPLLP